MKIQYLNSQQVTKNFAAHIVAFSVAESGAMGNPGGILFLTDEVTLYEVNYINDETMKEVFKVFNILDRCTNGFLGNGNELPSGWKYTYLGAGNHLFMLDYIDNMFMRLYPEKFQKVKFIVYGLGL